MDLRKLSRKYRSELEQEKDKLMKEIDELKRQDEQGEEWK